LSTMVKVLSDVNGWVVPMLVRVRHDPTLWNVVVLRLGNSHAIFPMTTAASAGAYLPSTPVELGLNAGCQLLPEAGAT
jgi:hypothetical protein